MIQREVYLSTSDGAAASFFLSFPDTCDDLLLAAFPYVHAQKVHTFPFNTHLDSTPLPPHPRPCRYCENPPHTHIHHLVHAHFISFLPCASKAVSICSSHAYTIFLFHLFLVSSSRSSPAHQSCTQSRSISIHIVLLRRRCRSVLAARRSRSDSVLNFFSSAVNSTPPPSAPPFPCRPVKAKKELLARLLILRPRLISRGEGNLSSIKKPLRGGEEEKTPLPSPPPPPLPLLLGLRLVVPAVGEAPRGEVMGVK